MKEGKANLGGGKRSEWADTYYFSENATNHPEMVKRAPARERDENEPAMFPTLRGNPPYKPKQPKIY